MFKWLMNLFIVGILAKIVLKKYEVFHLYCSTCQRDETSSVGSKTQLTQAWITSNQDDSFSFGLSPSQFQSFYVLFKILKHNDLFKCA